MPQRRHQAPPSPNWYDNWPMLPPPDLVRSDAARRFEDALLQYLNGQVSGRSFLIAGHRGAGKTTLVRNGADRLTHEILKSLVNEAKLGGIKPDSLASIPQRPLLVPVNGPSLILTELPGPGAGEAGSAAKDGAAEIGAKADDAKTASTGPIAPASPKQSILVQLTTALYRALARECAGAFAIHARSIGGADAAEIAAGLRLALDEAPDPALLRTYWQKFGFLERGVLWPEAVGKAFADANFSGQGLREIVAVATAAQIFEVAAGKVEFTRIKKDSNRVDQTAGKAQAAAWSDALKSAFGFSAGAAIGGGAAYGLELGSTLSLLAALAGGLAAGWTSSLSRTLEDTLDYRVTLDRSEASLERDLPLAIERIRAAGLAPVFLIDELDKLDDGKDGIKNTMRDLMFRMKQLTTDYGFFCFLVDRSYFDFVETRLSGGTYPVEHSFFSERLYVLPAPADLEAYVRGQFEKAGAAVDDSPQDHAVPVILAKHMLHTCKLNMLDLMRQLDGWTDIDDDVILSGLRYRLTAAIQIAIELVLAEPELAARAEQDISFRQSLIDALYIISRAWERDESEVRLGDDDIAKSLIGRMNKIATSDSKETQINPYETLEARIGKRDLELLAGAVRRLAMMLCDLGNLRIRLKKLDRYSDALLDIVTKIDPPLLKRAEDADDTSSQVFDFQYERFGRQNSDREGVPLDETEISEAYGLVFFRNLVGVATFPVIRLRFNDLAAVDMWPADLSSLLVTEAGDRVMTAADAGFGYAGFAFDKAILARAKDTFLQNLPGAITIVLLVIALTRDSNLDFSIVLRRISSVLDYKTILNNLREAPLSLAAIVDNPPPVLDGPFPSQEEIAGITGNIIKLAHWLLTGNAVSHRRDRRVPEPAGVWARCAQRLVRLFSMPNASPFPDPPDYDDLIVAAMDIYPAPLLRRDLSTADSVSAADWSFLALEAMMTGISLTVPVELATIQVPPWMVVPALFALGFNQSLLGTLAETTAPFLNMQPGKPPPAAKRLLDELPSMASQAPPGFLVIVADEAFSTQPRARQPGQAPVFLVRATHLVQYAKAIDALSGLNAFQGTIDEQAE